MSGYRFAATLIAAGVAVALSGCVGGAGLPVAMHGNFCGPNHPKLPSGIDRAGAVEFLVSVTPKDDLDRECQRHDMCYAARGAHDIACDVRLSTALANFKTSTECQARSTNIAGALAMKPKLPEFEGRDASGGVQTVAGATSMVVATALFLPFGAPYMAYQAVRGAGADICNGTFDEVTIAQRLEEHRRQFHMLYRKNEVQDVTPTAPSGRERRLR